MDVEKIGKTIAFLRKAHGMTQKDLAQYLNVSDKAVSKWERGLGIPDVSLLGKLSIVMDTDIESILEGNLFHSRKSWCGILFLIHKEKMEIFAGTYIYDKPLIHYQLSNFMLVGVRDILVVSTPENIAFATANLGNGEGLGIRLQYLNGDTCANEDICAFAAGRNAMVLYGSNVIFGVDLTKNFQRVMAKKNPVTAMAMNYPTIDNEEITIDDERRVILRSCKQEKSLAVQYYLLPFLFYKDAWVKGICPNYFDEFERLTADRLLFAEPLGRGMVAFQIESEEHKNLASEFIRIVQQTQCDQIANLGDIALRRGLCRESDKCEFVGPYEQK